MDSVAIGPSLVYIASVLIQVLQLRGGTGRRRRENLWNTY